MVKVGGISGAGMTDGGKERDRHEKREKRDGGRDIEET